MVNMMPASVTELLGCLARLVLFICKLKMAAMDIKITRNSGTFALLVCKS